MVETDVLVERLLRATNEHDLEGVVACFADDYENETPAHPARRFRGREQVRGNWQQIFAFVPDLEARVTRQATDGTTVWTEGEMSGMGRDGARHRMGGVIIFGVEQGQAAWARFYLEPVEMEAGTADDAVRA